MLAHMLSGVLAALPRIEALSYMQADHRGVGLETHISLTLPWTRYRYGDTFVYSHRIMNNNAESYVHNLVHAGGVGYVRARMGCKEKPRA